MYTAPTKVINCPIKEFELNAYVITPNLVKEVARGTDLYPYFLKLEVRICIPSIFHHVRLQVQTDNPDETLQVIMIISVRKYQYHNYVSSQTPFIYLSISTASPPLKDYVQVRVSAVLVEEMLLKIKSSHKIC